MVAPGFTEPVCFNPALVYFIAGLLAGVSYHYYTLLARKRATSAPTPSTKRRR